MHRFPIVLILFAGSIVGPCASAEPLQAAPVGASLPAAAVKSQPTELPPSSTKLSPSWSKRGSLDPDYVLGIDDEVTIRVTDVSEIPQTPLRIDKSGYLRLPLVERIKAAGLTLEQFGAQMKERLKKFVLDPEVSVSVSTFRSQPVSVMGAVKNPGVYQLEGFRTLMEVISLAGGLDDAASGTVKITRQLGQGRLPLENAVNDPSGQFSTTEISLNSIIGTHQAVDDITLQPFDVITVTRARMVYVMGQVNRAGGYIMRERRTMGLLQALALAGGLESTASPQNTRVLRSSDDGSSRKEIAVDLKKILEGKVPDVELLPEDILFVPTNAPKKVALRALEAAVQMGTGVVIWGKY